jgi:hypothetical protein
MPPLAWLAYRTERGERWIVYHGRFLETGEQFFIEGAWDGPFTGGAIDRAKSVFGSGGVISDGHPTFVSSTATTDCLYHNDNRESFAVSNSLPLLLAFSDDELRADVFEYSDINWSIRDGIRNYRSTVPTKNGHLRRVIFQNICVTEEGVFLVDKPLPPDFLDFQAYRDYLADSLKTLFDNARDPRRRRVMKVFSTQSKGYDSTAINALAQPFGVDAVFTCTESKEISTFYRAKQQKTPSDDGTPICDVLGLSCVGIDRREFERGLTDEELYWAAGDHFYDLNLHGIEKYVEEPTLLLTGTMGEMWYTLESAGEWRTHFIDDQLKSWDLQGHGLSERRLQSGFVQVAVPTIGARRRPAVQKITESEQMKPWRLGGSYDRPIPRRIGEEAGVPRDCFGQHKLASIVHLPMPSVPVSSELRKRYFRFLKEGNLLGWFGIGALPVMQRLNNWIYWRNPNRYFRDWRNHRVCYYAARLWLRLFNKQLCIKPVGMWLNSALYVFCVNSVRMRYRHYFAKARVVAESEGERDVTLN